MAQDMPPEQPHCYIFDIDGTLADLKHRRHFVERPGKKDWDAFFDACDGDEPIAHVISLANTLHIAGFAIVYVTGRPERLRMPTVSWLYHIAKSPWGPIYMRKDGDYRDDAIVKMELLRDVKRAGYVPLMAFDDRNKVVRMWRENGVPCCQVAEGDF